MNESNSSTLAPALLPGVVLERTAKRMKQYFQKQLQLAETDITIDQWVVLQELQHQDGHSQLDLAKATFKDAPTITRIIDLLCKKGLTERVVDAQDRRRFQIKLTAAGRAKIVKVQPIISEARTVAWQAISAQETDQMITTLNQIFDNLSKSTDD